MFQTMSLNFVNFIARIKTSNKKSEATRNKEMLLFCVFIELRASFKLDLSVKDYVILDVHRHLIFLAFFWYENFLN